MKKLFFTVFAAAMLALCAGCVTSTVTPVYQYGDNSKLTKSGKIVIADIEATNYTSYLFGFIPILGGSHTRPNAWQYYMWTDTVSDRKTRSMMNWYAKRVLKADGVDNVKITRKTIGWPTLWIVSWRTVQATAQVIKEPKK